MYASTQSSRPAWGAVFSMALGVFALVTSEFLPSSLLTPMAAGMGVTEGGAGQAVTVTAFVALFASLLVSTVMHRVDRRAVFLAFSALLVVSDLLVAVAPNVSVLLAARILLGIAIGGFWTMSTAAVMRLVPESDIPRALSIVFSGVAAATIVAAPVGSYLGAIIGWRLVFLVGAALGLVALVTQAATLPRMAPRSATNLGTLLAVMRRPGIGIGVVAAGLVFAGHFAFFTYLRPFLEDVTGVGISGVSGMLLVFGVANFLGSAMGSWVIKWGLSRTLITMPLIMGMLGIGLAGLGGSQWGAVTMIAAWGMVFGIVPMSWSTWVADAVPDEAEAAGGLIVAAIQTGIAAGAAVGGAIVDASGVSTVFVAGSVVLLAAMLLAWIATRPRSVHVASVVQAKKASLADTCSQFLSTPQESIRETN
ncbi:MFS transporter [Allopusillimonas soli]|uniref:MFS transporter n=1 Tax=Allopusillimonas soli TaxID=659016 RepID=A0A853FK17_9BURK|nr:MFS transporter [Allopusillimonas soli]NYT38711.1 MFS transporter [Allopusillimonas soli]TEA71591.1 MFS transporter [Allopusillimonas soli]